MTPSNELLEMRLAHDGKSLEANCFSYFVRLTTFIILAFFVKASTDLFGSFQSLSPVQIILASFNKVNLVRVQAQLAFHGVLHLHVFNLVIFLFLLAAITVERR